MITNEHAKELPWNMPVITGFPQYANVLAITGQLCGAELWLLSHCVQLQVNKGSYTMLNLDYSVGDMLNTVYRCPYLSIEVFDIAEFTGDVEKMVEKIIYYIDQGKYIYMPVDWFYIPAYQCYGENHVSHDMLILGYDKEKEEFSIADFFGNFQYQKATCKYEELISACNKDDAYKLPCILKKVLILKPCEQVVPFDIRTVKSLFEDYLEGNNSNRRFLPVCQYIDFLDEECFAFGLNVYEPLMGYLEDAVQKGNSVALRSYAVLYDHKVLLSKVCSYMADKGYLQSGGEILTQVEMVRKQCLIVRNLLIKYNLAGDTALLKRCIHMLEDIRKSEEILFTKILDNITAKPVLYRFQEEKYAESLASFVGEDRQTLGNWIGKYGSGGYDIFLEEEMGDQISITYHNFIYKKWSNDWSEITDLYVRRKKGDKAFAACKHFRKDAYIDILIRDGLQYVLSIYVLAWWEYERRFCIRLVDGDNGKPLCSHEVVASNEGLYVSFLVSGHVRLEFENRSREIGVISGVFFQEISDL